MTENTITTTAAKTRANRNGGDLPTELHYVRRRSRVREDFALCGEYMPHASTVKGESVKASGDGIMCPMCQIVYDDLNGRGDAADRMLYGDTGDPLREAVRATALRHLAKVDLTIPECARKAGLYPRRLYMHIMDGNLTTDEIAAISNATGFALFSFLLDLDTCHMKRLRHHRDNDHNDDGEGADRS